MMRSTLVAIVLGLAATGPLWAQRQVDTGTHIAVPKRAEIPNERNADERGRIALRQYARCTVARSREETAAALLLDPGKDADALNKLASDECLQAGRMEFAPNVYRGALYGELYRLRAKQAGKRWTLPIQPLSLATPPASDATGSVRANFFLLDLAHCLYQAAPEAVREIIVEPTASEGQERAFASVIPVLGPCIPAGRTLTLNRITLESAFGEYLYRMPETPAPPASARP